MKGSRVTALALAGFVGAALVAGCQEADQGMAKISFKGRATDSKGQGVSAFTLSVSRTPSAAQPKSVNVTTRNGQYEAKVAVDAPAVAGSKTLGSKTEPVLIQIAATGYKTKTFRVTADQVLVTEPNTLNVTLEPAQ